MQLIMILVNLTLDGTKTVATLQFHMPKLELSKRRAIALASKLGLAIVAPLLIFLMGGRFLDSRLNSMPLWTIVGLTIGFVTTIIMLILIVRGISDGERTAH